MATADELLRQYETDEKLQQEVAEILDDGKISVPEFLRFCKKHQVDVPLSELPQIVEKAKKYGFLK